MGCDGGTIPKRDELVRKKKKPEQKDKNSELSFRWQHCTITQQPLKSPIVACGLGRLYNKDAVIEAILDKTKLPEVAQHIKGIKDVKDLQLTNNPSYNRSIADKGDAYIDRQAAQYICPVTGLEMNGKFKFVFLWKCGCVCSERALKSVKTSTCHKCQKPFSEEDLVILNAELEDLDLMKTRLEARQARLRAEKKAKQEAKHNSTVTSNGEVNSQTDKPAACSSNGNDHTADNSSAHINITNKVIDENKLKSKEKTSSKIVDSSLKRSAASGIPDPQFKKTKSCYSIAKDPVASEVYKSLFTSHETAQQKSKAHWITYNPFYN